jgi:hypothetical protein
MHPDENVSVLMDLHRSYAGLGGNPRYIDAFPDVRTIWSKAMNSITNTPTNGKAVLSDDRHASFVGNALMAVVIAGFAGAAIGAALLDLIAMRQ